MHNAADGAKGCWPSTLGENHEFEWKLGVQVDFTTGKCLLFNFIQSYILLTIITIKVSERNGPICGYRIYLVRIGKHNKHMGTPASLPVMSYKEAHAANNTKTSAYIAEILSIGNFQTEVFLGDQQRVPRNESHFEHIHNEQCRKLLNGYYVKTLPAKLVTTTTISPPANAVHEDDGAGKSILKFWEMCVYFD